MFTFKNVTALMQHYGKTKEKQQHRYKTLLPKQHLIVGIEHSLEISYAKMYNNFILLCWGHNGT